MAEYLALAYSQIKAKLIDGDNHLLALSRYARLNPVKVAGVKSKTTEEKE